ncbi:MAG: 2-amino-4-hydroxy-6-hydroxymethyldihydropteridine diphosphokinase [Bacteroidaceae bacterium]|nr:2-amino-4-hydroxy-6-hydroxymethyldihydropteridine diphosphokinase [Bacteroidaceae bacterium]
MTDVYLGLGSNLGDRHTLLLAAIEQLVQRVGRLVRCSSFIETEPWGFVSEHPFLNAVALFRTTLSPRELLVITQAIERELGRKEKTTAVSVPSGTVPLPSYQDRPIDIDILLYGDEHIDEPDLKIPHPLMHDRDFVMRPLSELRSLLAAS